MGFQLNCHICRAYIRDCSISEIQKMNPTEELICDACKKRKEDVFSVLDAILPRTRKQVEVWIKQAKVEYEENQRKLVKEMLDDRQASQGSTE